MNKFQVVQKYLPQAIDAYFKENLLTRFLDQGSKYVKVDFNMTGYVQVADITLDGLGNYHRAQENPRPNNPENYAAYAGNLGNGERDGYSIGNASLKWEPFALQWQRSKRIPLDGLSDEESAATLSSNIVETFSTQKAVPEIDASRFSEIVKHTSVTLGNRVVETISANQIIGKFNTGIQYLKKHEVPQEDIIIYVSNEVMTLIRSTTELSKLITQGDYRNEAGITFTVEKYNGYPIIEVPDTRFFTNVLLTDDGYRASSDSKVINFLMLSKKAVAPVIKVEHTSLLSGDIVDAAGFYGYMFNTLLYHGIVIPRNKAVAIYASVSQTDATQEVNTLGVATEKGSSALTWRMTNYLTNPSGQRGYVVYTYYDASTQATNPFTLGGAISSVGTEGSDYFVAEVDQNNTASATTDTAFFALVNNGVIVATSGTTAVALDIKAGA